MSLTWDNKAKAPKFDRAPSDSFLRPPMLPVCHGHGLFVLLVQPGGVRVVDCKLLANIDSCHLLAEAYRGAQRRLPCSLHSFDSINPIDSFGQL